MNLITANQANAGGREERGPAGASESPVPAVVRAEHAGPAFPGTPGASGLSGTGIGGGLNLLAGGTVVIDDTNITGNHATTSNDDVFGTFTT